MGRRKSESFSNLKDQQVSFFVGKYLFASIIRRTKHIPELELEPEEENGSFMDNYHGTLFLSILSRGVLYHVNTYEYICLFNVI